MRFNQFTTRVTGAICLIFMGFLSLSTDAAVGESAVITLIFPPGARATAMGEAFTGLADDANATYYNPAGLGMAPMANSWKIHLKNKGYSFTSLTAKRKKEFGAKSLVWAGTNKGLLRYNGKTWESYEIYLIEQNDDLESIVSKFLKIDDPDVQKKALWTIYVQNKIEMKRYNLIRDKLKSLVTIKDNDAQKTADSLAKEIILCPALERSSAKIYAIIQSSMDSLKADSVSDQINDIFSTKDIVFENLDEIKIPFEIAVTDSISCLTIDNSDRLWAGTANGIWRYTENEWNHYTVKDGLPSNYILSVASDKYGAMAAGTDMGIALYKDGQWTTVDTIDGLPSNTINSLAYGINGTLYAGTPSGAAKITDSTIVIYDTTNSLLSNNVSALFYDSKDRLWIGGDSGVVISTPTSWKRYNFVNTKVLSFTEHGNGNVWIGTNKGAISYKTGKIQKDESGNPGESVPEWKTFHSKNVLSDDNVVAIVDHNDDVWLATNNAINQFDNSNLQVFLFYEKLLPAFKIEDLWHAYGAVIFPTQDWGTFGLTVNFISMGENIITRMDGYEEATVKSWEGVFGLSYGLPIKENFSLGLNIKWVHSALAPGYGKNGEGVGQTFAIDAALLKRNFLINNLDLGFMLQNMGPDIFYVDRSSRDPIPFTLRLGTTYRAVQTPVHDLKFLLDFNREFVKNNENGNPDPFIKALFSDFKKDKNESTLQKLEETNVNLGLEYWYSNFIALRTGLLADYIGYRYEWTFGLGVKYGTLNFDWSYIFAPTGFMRPVLKLFDAEHTEGASGARNGQWRASFIFQY
jgi:hypothetical protein